MMYHGLDGYVFIYESYPSDTCRTLYLPYIYNNSQKGVETFSKVKDTYHLKFGFDYIPETVTNYIFDLLYKTSIEKIIELENHHAKCWYERKLITYDQFLEMKRDIKKKTHPSYIKNMKMLYKE